VNGKAVIESNVKTSTKVVALLLAAGFLLTLFLKEGFGSLGQSFAVFVGPLLEMLLRDGIAAGLAAIILFAAVLFGTLYYVAIHRPTKIELSALQDYIEREIAQQIKLEQDRAPAETMEDGEDGWGSVPERLSLSREEAFARAESSIRQAISGRKLQRVWAEFFETTIDYDLNDPGSCKGIRNTERPQDYFTPDAVIEEGTWWRELPGWFVAFGLFITFIGLVSALTQATEGIVGAAGDKALMADSIQNLLAAAAVKFYASAAALLGSVLLNIEFNLYRGRNENRLLSLCDTLEGVLEYAFSEKLLDQQISISTQQLKVLQHFNTDLAMKVGDAVTNGMSGAMEGVMVQLKTISENLGEANLEAFQKAVKEVMQTASGDMVEMQVKAAQSAENTATTLDNADAQMRQTMESISRATEMTIDKVMKQLDSSIGDLTLATTSMGDQFGAAAVAMHNSITELGTKLEESGQVVGEALEAGAQGVVSSVGTLVQSNVRQIIEATEGFDGQIERLEQQLVLLGSTVDSLKKELEEGTDFVKDSNVVLASSNDTVREVLENLVITGNRLPELSAQIKDFGERYSEQSISLSEATMTSVTAMRDSANHVRDSIELMSKNTEKLNGTYETIRNNIVDSVGPLTEGYERVLNSFQEHTKRIDSSMADAVMNLDGAVARMGDSFQELGAELEKINEPDSE